MFICIRSFILFNGVVIVFVVVLVIVFVKNRVIFFGIKFIRVRGCFSSLLKLGIFGILNCVFNLFIFWLLFFVVLVVNVLGNVVILDILKNFRKNL